MGAALGACCQSDLFSDLRQKYGQSFTKLMLAEKAKQFIATHFGSLTSKFTSIFGGFKDQVSSITGSKKQQVHQLYEKIKLQANNTLPGGLHMLEQIKGQSIDEFSGYNALQSKIDSIQSQAVGKLESEKQVLLGQMNTRKDGMVAQIQQERPKIQYYEALPDGLKTMLRHQAQTVLAQEIKNNQSTITESIAKQFNPQNAQQLFSKLNPESQLGSLVGQASQLLSSAFGLGGGGGIGGLIQNGLKIFS